MMIFVFLCFIGLLPVGFLGINNYLINKIRYQNNLLISHPKLALPPSEPTPKPVDPMEVRKKQLFAWNDQNLWNNVKHAKRSKCTK